MLGDVISSRLAIKVNCNELIDDSNERYKHCFWQYNDYYGTNVYVI